MLKRRIVTWKYGTGGGLVYDYGLVQHAAVVDDPLVRAIQLSARADGCECRLARQNLLYLPIKRPRRARRLRSASITLSGTCAGSSCPWLLSRRIAPGHSRTLSIAARFG